MTRRDSRSLLRCATTRFRGLEDFFGARSTGSRTHPWLDADTRFAG